MTESLEHTTPRVRLRHLAGWALVAYGLAAGTINALDNHGLSGRLSGLFAGIALVIFGMMIVWRSTSTRIAGTAAALLVLGLTLAPLADNRAAQHAETDTPPNEQILNAIHSDPAALAGVTAVSADGDDIRITTANPNEAEALLQVTLKHVSTGKYGTYRWVVVENTDGTTLVQQASRT
ncbi:putative protein OS=Tsukamurella paurometabola (strain ATCC 8368 / DSM / CCUG 35730 /CIP 100753 / JCM 10117 / KCTC 9821 / NBRC 16120 / NCIMB 702349/ NCTC 13040) OX=521096 GN=Tpau_0311 PE=4 SV=1 [Tsukamurella paurometabola]|uniref:Uncharacterized protein n=1 Tax=Tsukamurella paurometabola (strain ATCC 8368 / DSM 20162 / CCUG 35730 / CIP 100753 / JCM 10117 / KCTC 9821 / NBRC 16120 / NCIMB 702349 / NCTC 13040) TaxID=521096 RepID=D5URA4_TSUPD|nr:hypothetical protein [Tsukamurella paurometabola]ADG76957.1 hypothetical protein Tpau_0311 [Tsukamurella paurometabola DSM 20162]SUP42321.1 Uncharacterised protein [Tsukamurella paurometabola]